MALDTDLRAIDQRLGLTRGSATAAAVANSTCCSVINVVPSDEGAGIATGDGATVFFSFGREIVVRSIMALSHRVRPGFPGSYQENYERRVENTCVGDYLSPW